MSKPSRILIVDDEPEILKVYGMKLKLAGYDVATAPDGKKALAVAKTYQPDLILMDMKMPEMDGMEALGKIQEDPALKNTKVVFLTAFSDPANIVGDVRIAKELGAVDFIKKGLSLDDLVARVKRILASAQ